jgi:hypothetical protein
MNLFKSTKNKNGLVPYQNLLKTANSIANINPKGLPDLVSGILRPYQLESILAVAEYGTDAIANITAESIFGKFIQEYVTYDALKENEIADTEFFLHLAKHLVFPWPWKYERYVNALATIGSKKHTPNKIFPWIRDTAWRQDSNHYVTLWLPWGLGFVDGGNHSIAAGILAGEGTIKPRHVYDMQFLLQLIHNDGLYWYETKTKKKLSPVENYRVAAVFEIGRIMLEKNCSAFFDDILNNQIKMQIN